MFTPPRRLDRVLSKSPPSRFAVETRSAGVLGVCETHFSLKVLREADAETESLRPSVVA